MGDLFNPIFAKLRNLKTSGLISYKLAWTYFPRDSLLFSDMSDCTRVLKVVDTSYVCGKEPKMLIQAKEIAFDGEEFSWRDVVVSIPPFGGNTPITTLPNYPLEFHVGKQEIMKRLEERANKVLKYQDLEYCEYEGLGVLMNGCKAERHNVSF